jgi:hypothetical protein
MMRPIAGRQARHRGVRHGLATAVLAFVATMVFTHRAACADPVVASGDSRSAASGADSARVLVSIAGGVQWVDLPRFDHPNETIGGRSRFAFGSAVRVRRWFEPHAELAFAYLGGSDSLDAALAALGTTRVSLGTLVQLQAGARLRWARAGRWQPFVNLAAGVARRRLEASSVSDHRETDAVWSAGLGAEFWLHRHFMLRGEGLYVGQAAREGTRTHTVLQLATVYSFDHL